MKSRDILTIGIHPCSTVSDTVVPCWNLGHAPLLKQTLGENNIVEKNTPPRRSHEEFAPMESLSVLLA